MTKLAHLKGHTGAVYHFSSDDHRVFSAGADGKLVLWLPKESTNGELLVQAPEAWYCSLYDPNSGILYAGSRSGRVLGVDIADRSIVYDAQRHEGAVFCLIRHGDVLLSGGQDGVLVGDSFKLKISDDSLRCVLPVQDGLWIGDSGGAIHALDVEFGVRHSWLAHERAVFALEDMDGDGIASTGMDARIRIWDSKTWGQMAEVVAHGYQAKALSFNGTVLASCSMDKTIRLWDPDLNLLRQVDLAKDQGHTNCVNCVRWLDGDVFVSSSDDRSLIVWQMDRIR